jgi:hypothetical protein
MGRTEDTILKRIATGGTAQKRAPITAHGSSGCYMDQNAYDGMKVSFDYDFLQCFG